MKVKDLIKLLEGLPQNSDITVWNGLVGDIMPIGDVIRTEVVRMSFDYYVSTCFLEEVVREGRDENDLYTENEIAELKKSHKKYHTYELNQYVSDDDIKSGRYDSKKVCILEPKLTGKKSFDRLGEISY